MENEIWKDIPDFELRYQVSSTGYVKSLRRVSRLNKVIHEKLLKLRKAGSGYCQIFICKPGQKQRAYVHRLVATAFIPNHENLPEVNHLNGIKTDNRVENLQWCTKSQNTIHSYKHLPRSKNRACGSSHHKALLNEDQVSKIIKIAARIPKPTNKEIGKIFNVASQTIQGIVSRRTWKHIQ